MNKLLEIVRECFCEEEYNRYKIDLKKPNLLENNQLFHALWSNATLHSMHRDIMGFLCPYKKNQSDRKEKRREYREERFLKKIQPIIYMYMFKLVNIKTQKQYDILYTETIRKICGAVTQGICEVQKNYDEYQRIVIGEPHELSFAQKFLGLLHKYIFIQHSGGYDNGEFDCIQHTFSFMPPPLDNRIIKNCYKDGIISKEEYEHVKCVGRISFHSFSILKKIHIQLRVQAKEEGYSSSLEYEIYLWYKLEKPMVVKH